MRLTAKYNKFQTQSIIAILYRIDYIEDSLGREGGRRVRNNKNLQIEHY